MALAKKAHSKPVPLVPLHLSTIYHWQLNGSDQRS